MLAERRLVGAVSLPRESDMSRETSTLFSERDKRPDGGVGASSRRPPPHALLAHGETLGGRGRRLESGNSARSRRDSRRSSAWRGLSTCR